MHTVFYKNGPYTWNPGIVLSFMQEILPIKIKKNRLVCVNMLELKDRLHRLN